MSVEAALSDPLITEYSILVRRLTWRDVHLAKDVHALLFKCFYEETTWEEDGKLIVKERLTLDQIIELLENPLSYLFVAEYHHPITSETRIVGCVEVLYDPSINESTNSKLAVDPSFRGFKIADKLGVFSTNFSRKVLKCNAAVGYVLNVRQDILQLYKRYGWGETGKRTPYPWPESTRLGDSYFIQVRREFKQKTSTKSTRAKIDNTQAVSARL
ncbi:hypothetical protein K493DRAFT_337888 [Basidiobolus meristosporus CBS 931.73]|uniref:N-acetyltransferase domain-containing protein n=1 Tax=Basidiobolus meristosporus CBS 931.73 TaxID=1314790 RepID=A0A1Y1Y8N2_9FUNG|nr:hypothetical protein K493DRAFT_337888 [Basidiobolus meristosporus CBS 931.73]|eukprot:ORX94235.1 hypothetical protein K493DRAFT_337888 [Basidiobolus meristosporus CBS 931.73]